MFTMRHKILAGLIAVGLATSLAACSSGSDSSADKKEITVGLLSREEPEMQLLADEMAKKGYTMHLKVMSDNIAMNRATADGSLDGNFFQNQKYLDAQEAANPVGLKSYGPWLETTATLLVSSKFDSIADVANGAKLGLSNDAANMARCLRLAAANDLITLNDDPNPSILSVKDNPKNIEFIAADPRSVSSMYPDLDVMCAISTTVFLMNDPSIKTIAEEPASVYEPYGGVLWVVKNDAGKLPWLDAAIEIMQSDNWKAFVKDHFNDLKKTP